MPIVGAKPQECFDRFVDHLRGLTSKTIEYKPHLAELYTNPQSLERVIAFREGDPVAVPIDTNYGMLFFYLSQRLVVVERPERPRGERFRLETMAYWYRIQKEPEGHALFRWEYERELPSGKLHARHHLQLHGALTAEKVTFDLNKLHTPTGWVLVEHVIRFLINDLGMKPPCGAAWVDLVEEGERLFLEEFTNRRAPE